MNIMPKVVSVELNLYWKQNTSLSKPVNISLWIWYYSDSRERLFCFCSVAAARTSSAVCARSLAPRCIIWVSAPHVALINLFHTWLWPLVYVELHRNLASPNVWIRFMEEYREMRMCWEGEKRDMCRDDWCYSVKVPSALKGYCCNAPPGMMYDL